MPWNTSSIESIRRARFGWIADGVVTATRANADFVVSEYGIAELRGRGLEERAAALITIAHPDFRRELQDAAGDGLV